MPAGEQMNKNQKFIFCLVWVINSDLSKILGKDPVHWIVVHHPVYKFNCDKQYLYGILKSCLMENEQ